MKQLLLLLLAAGTLNFISCNSQKADAGISSGEISVEDIENNTTATDQAETTTAMVDSMAVITSDTSVDEQ